jgi:hypothetical protein
MECLNLNDPLAPSNKDKATAHELEDVHAYVGKCRYVVALNQEFCGECSAVGWATGLRMSAENTMVTSVSGRGNDWIPADLAFTDADA